MSPRPHLNRPRHAPRQALGYPEFLKFASDFDLSNSVILSTLEVGDIYLSSIKAVAPDATIRKLTFPEFWEALVRCALVAYRCARVSWVCVSLVWAAGVHRRDGDWESSPLASAPP